MNPWAVLGVVPGAAATEVKRVRRALLKRHHPDLIENRGRAQAAPAMTVEINLAYAMLKDD